MNQSGQMSAMNASENLQTYTVFNVETVRIPRGSIIVRRRLRSNGSHFEVERAVAGSMDGERLYVAAYDINPRGYGTVFDMARIPLDTSLHPVGTPVYLSATNPGEYTFASTVTEVGRVLDSAVEGWVWLEPTYYRANSSGGGSLVTSVNALTGDVVLTAAHVGADPIGTAVAVLSTHEAAANPHPQYVQPAAVPALAPVQSVAGKVGVVALNADDLTNVAGVAAAAASLVMVTDGLGNLTPGPVAPLIPANTFVKTLNSESPDALGNLLLSLDDVADVGTVGAVAGEALTFDGVTWAPDLSVRTLEGTSGDITLADLGLRKTWPITNQDIYVELEGDDINGDGLTVGTAYATIHRALLDVPQNNNRSMATTIHLGAGGFVLPLMVAGEFNYVSIVAELSVVETGTVIGVMPSTDASGILVSLSGTSATVANDHLGWQTEFTSGPAVGRRGLVTYNDGGTQFRMSQNHIGVPRIDPIIGDVVDFYAYNTALLLGGATTLAPGIQFNVKNLILSGPAHSMFILDTDKLEFSYCEIEVQKLIVGRNGGAYFRCCNIKNHANNIRGMLSAKNDGELELFAGTLVDGQNASATRAFIEVTSGNLRYRGEVVLRDVESIKLRNASVQCAEVITVNDIFRVMTPIFKYDIKGTQGCAFLPHTFGNTTEDFFIEASKGAIVEAGGSIMGTATGNNSVSADAGDNNCSVYSDGTRILGGSPALVAHNMYSLPNNNPEEEVARSTTSSINLLLHTTSFDVPQGGDVSIDFSVLYRYSTTLRDAIFTFMLDGVLLHNATNVLRAEVKDSGTDQRVYGAFSAIRYLAPGAHTLEIYYRTSDPGDTVTVYRTTTKTTLATH